MTKFNEIPDDSAKHYIAKKIDEQSHQLLQLRNNTLSRINNYLFTINGGGLLASLTYVAAKENAGGFYLTICFFALGLLCAVLHAAIDYYGVEFFLPKYSSDVTKFYSNKIEWEDLVANIEKRAKIINPILHPIGWLSGLAFLVALYSGFSQLT